MFRMRASDRKPQTSPLDDSLQISEKRFHSLFNGPLIGITIANRQGHLLEVNEAFCKMIGYPLDEVKGKHFKDFTHVDDVEIDQSLFEQLWDGQMEQYFMTKRYLHRDGHDVWVELHVSQYIGLNGEPLEIALIQDITARRSAEEALKDLNLLLEERIQERTNELATTNRRLKELDVLKSKFVADATHELRIPLATLTMRIELMELAPPERIKHYLPELKAQIHRLNNFVNDVLDLSRIEATQSQVDMEIIRLNTAVEYVVLQEQMRAEAVGLRLIFQPQTDLPFVRGNMRQLQQIVSNLVANAINYTKAGDVIVSTRFDLSEGEVVLTVQDTGMGIEPSALPHIFDRFYRAKGALESEIPGTGLGLSLVKEMVEAHGGYVRVSSSKDVGSVFSVFLPAVVQ